MEQIVRMTTAEIRPDTYVPVELLRWTDSGMVQVRYRRVVTEHIVFGQQVGPLGRDPGAHVVAIDSNRDGSPEWMLDLGELAAGTDLVVWWAGDSSGAPTVAVTDRTGVTRRLDAVAVVD